MDKLKQQVKQRTGILISRLMNKQFADVTVCFSLSNSIIIIRNGEWELKIYTAEKSEIYAMQVLMAGTQSNIIIILGFYLFLEKNHDTFQEKI